MNKANTINENNLDVLGRILTPDCSKKYQELFASWLYDTIIPWSSRANGEDMTEPEVICAIQDEVKDSFNMYQGSMEGYGSHNMNRKMLYGVLWGKEAADSLMNEDFIGTAPVCNAVTDAQGNTHFHISLIPEGQNIAISKRQLDWCKNNAPEGTVGHYSDCELVQKMTPAWLQFGNHKSSLPFPPELTEEEQNFIMELFQNDKCSNVTDTVESQEASVEQKMKEYDDMGYNQRQLKEIRLGLERGLDVSLYADPKFGWDQMAEIRFGLEGGLDVSAYAKPEFDWKQMQEIRMGLEKISRSDTPQKMDF